MYVWFEALLNYLTVANKYKSADFEFVHVIGKDISKFHAYIWPLMLLLHGKIKISSMSIVMHNHWLMNEVILALNEDKNE